MQNLVAVCHIEWAYVSQEIWGWRRGGLYKHAPPRVTTPNLVIPGQTVRADYTEIRRKKWARIYSVPDFNVIQGQRN